MPMKSPGRKLYTTMRGKQIDMDMLRKKNELTPAVGNARVNARGDVLGKGGKIVKKREEVMQEYYKVPSKTQEIVEEDLLSEQEQEIVEEATQDDEWFEDENGNFVKKGE